MSNQTPQPPPKPKKSPRPEHDSLELNKEQAYKEVKGLLDNQNLGDNKHDRIFELYQTIVDTRKFEIENFWKRTVFFWGTLAIIIVGYFKIEGVNKYSLFIALLGLFYNIIFSLSLRGSKYWQEHWEGTARAYEEALEFKVFRWKLKKRITEANKDVPRLIRPFKYSVSKLTMVLSDITIFVWFMLVVERFDQAFKDGDISFAKDSQFSFFASGVFIFIFIFGYYIYVIINRTIKWYKEK